MSQEKLFDPIRKKWIISTPEELVRQKVLSHLLYDLKIPGSIISVEKEIKFNTLKKRYDVVVYNGTQAFILIECKAAHISLSEDFFYQALQYNSILKAPYFMLTNSIQAFLAKIDPITGQINSIPTLPTYPFSSY